MFPFSCLKNRFFSILQCAHEAVTKWVLFKCLKPITVSPLPLNLLSPIDYQLCALTATFFPPQRIPEQNQEGFRGTLQI